MGDTMKREFRLVDLPLFVFLIVFLPGSSLVAKAQDSQPPATYTPPGKQLYRNHCASCHGLDGKGSGPVSHSLRKPPPDLTSLSKRHGGKFPGDYVTEVLRFGLNYSSHGSSEMPVWGPIFQDEEHYNEGGVRQRIRNLCEYLESLQQE